MFILADETPVEIKKGSRISKQHTKVERQVKSKQHLGNFNNGNDCGKTTGNNANPMSKMKSRKESFYRKSAGTDNFGEREEFVFAFLFFSLSFLQKWNSCATKFLDFQGWCLFQVLKVGVVELFALQ